MAGISYVTYFPAVFSAGICLFEVFLILCYTDTMKIIFELI